MTDLKDLSARLAAFAAARDWEKFHTPKNLAMALAGETGELLAELQWFTDPEIIAKLDDPAYRARVADEIADVLLYTIRLADICGIDPAAAANAKITHNGTRFPIPLTHADAD